MTNVKSILARLKNISKENKISMQSVLYRYFHERFLYRTTLSPYKDHFILKGGNLIFAHEGLIARPTIDIDLLGYQISNDIDQILNYFSEIANIEINDGVMFITPPYKYEIINESNTYNGIRLTFGTSLGNVRQNIQIDIGFGDVITPAEIDILYPTLLKDEHDFSIKAYSLETVIAEKFHTMVVLGEINSRMKDFYDVFHLLESPAWSPSVLADAITETFKNRDTWQEQNLILFDNNFRKDAKRNKMFQAYLHKIGSADTIDFNQVMEKITDVLYPIYQTLKTKEK